MVPRRENQQLEFRPEALNGSIGKRFAQVVACVPDAPAIINQDASWTYAELNEQSDRLALAILETQTAGQEPILLLFDRVSMAIAAMLACIKIGHPYVPLSPSNPQLRIDLIRESSDAMLLLTEPSCVRLAKQIASSDLPVIETPAVMAAESVPKPLPPVSADTLVWILFTSGSTGFPKGVMQTHRNILHYTLHYTQALALSCDDRIGLLFSYASNTANHEILAALLNGAAICPFDVKQHGISPLAEWLEKTEITVYSSVPTLFRRFVEDLPGTQRFPSLRHVKLVGEPVFRRDLEAFRAHFTTTCSFINRLGSTETGTIRCYFAGVNEEADGVNVPVGFPVPDYDIVLLDDAGRPVPAGEPGEIVARGRYLSPGYWRRPDLTEKAFFGEGDGRCFRTGDVGLMLPGECLVYLGRRDAQIKVRGFRIEIGEIESALLEHPAVKEVIALVREDHPDDPQLVAYFTIKQGELEPTVSELRRHLADRLPDYMVPNAFVSLLDFPLAPNGKIDRSALPPVGTERPRLDAAYVAPRTPIEQELARLWGELLHLEDIGIRDSFFELGGHSLLAVQLIARIEKIFGASLPLSVLFDYPTLEELSKVVQERDPGLARSTIACLQKGDDGPPFFCVPPAASSVNHFAQLVQTLSADIPFYGVQALGLEPDEVPQDRMKDMAARYIADMRAIQPNGPYLIGGRCLGGYIAYEMALQLTAVGEKVALLALLDPTLPPGMRRDLRYYVGRAGYFSRRKQLIRAVLRRIRWTVRQVERLRVLRYLGSRHTRRIQRTYKAHLHAHETYAPGVYSGPITFFAPREEYSPDDSRPLWKNQTSGGFELHLVPGTHLTMSQDPHLQTLVRELEAVIYDARRGLRTAAQKEEWQS